MKKLLPLLLLGMLFTAQAEEVLYEDSFETKGTIPWETTWGPTKRSMEKARTGTWAIKETLENKHGLSVQYLKIPAEIGTVYTVSAWAFVPSETQSGACLSIGTTNWRSLATAKTSEKNKWVKLEATYQNRGQRNLQFLLFQDTQKPNLGGQTMYWDDVQISRKAGTVDPKAGMRINPHVIQGLDAVADGMRITIKPGKMNVNGKEVQIKEETVFTFVPPRRVQVRDEKAKLKEEVPRSYNHGTALSKIRGRGATVKRLLAPDSIRVKKQAGPQAELWQEGKDWRADTDWGQVGRFPDGGISDKDVVFIDYAYSLMRIDTIAVRDDGKVLLFRGAERKLCPEPPQTDSFTQPLCNIYLPYHCQQLTVDNIYPIGTPFPSPSQSTLDAKAALIPKTRAKLEQGGPFTILFWGDSVTCGGDASSPEMAFPLKFTNWLRIRYPKAEIKHVNAGTGGWNSNTKLPLFEKEVLAHKPDLMVIEFVNDMGMGRETMFKNYDSAIGRVRDLGGETIILTPHFTRPDWMVRGSMNMRIKETRAAVTHIREYGKTRNIGIADTSRRWEHLWLEGLPFFTLLMNGINHPDDRGHQLFVDDLKLFFLGKTANLAPKGMKEQDMPDKQP